MTHRAVVCVIALVALAACGGGQPEPTQPSNPPASSAASAAPGGSAPAPAESAAPAASAGPVATAPPGPPGPGQWDSWSHDQKLGYMKAAVMPKMGALFHEFDAKRFAEPKCAMCHASGAKDGTFKMPDAALPKLNMADGMKGDKAKHAKIFDFMVKDVEEQMAGLVGEKPYDPKTQKGFGCFDCHTKK